jgi:peptidoglycan/LPS O-acetylase OafA/YrhL
MTQVDALADDRVSGAPPVATQVPRHSLVWLDALKGAAILWIILNHATERLWGGPSAGNPAAGWPALPARIAEWQPLRTGQLAPDLIENLLRAIGWVGDQGVTLFLLLSGLGIAYGLARKKTPELLEAGTFFRARAGRIYPQWWLAHAAFALGAWATGKLMLVAQPAFFLSLLGVRVTEQTMYSLVPAWWYVSLILQLYIIFPVLWWAARRWGAPRMLAVCVVAGFAARALGPLLFTGYLDPWLRGAIFITRLPEFALGIALGIALAEAPARTARALRAPRTALLGGGMLALGFAFSFTLGGMIAAPFLMGTGAFVLGYAATAGGRKPGVLSWFGRHSYALYLVHQPLVHIALRAHDASLLRIIGGLAAALGASVVLAVLLERLTGAIAGHLRLTAIAAACGLIAVYGANAAVTAFAPQEIFGWGERPSLVPDAAVGWKLAPSRTTHLRWQTYDYTMKANALGFPAPEVPATKPAGVTRIMTTGNAFTSGDGIAPERVWPRLLERDLAKQGMPAQVLNFGITGHGPNQFAAVVHTYAPQVKPDIVIVEMFTKEFDDVFVDDDTLRRNIGFGNPDPLGFRATAEAAQLRTYLRLEIGDRLFKALGKPRATTGAFLSDVQAFDLERPALARSIALVRGRLAAIQSDAERLHAKLYVVMVPASVQVCEPADLPYYPQGIFTNTARYDLDLPQRMTRGITSQLGIPFLDLRAALRAGSCPYWKTNMHWTPEGHERASAAIARMIRSAR